MYQIQEGKLRNKNERENPP